MIKMMTNRFPIRSYYNTHYYILFVMSYILTIESWFTNSYIIIPPCSTISSVTTSSLKATYRNILSSTYNTLSLTCVFSNNNNNDDDDDPDTSKFFELISSSKEMIDYDNNNDLQQRKLGIDIGKMLKPLSNNDATELKVAATEIINDAYAEGLDEIAKLRERMEADLEKQRKTMELKSDFLRERESDILMKKIDTITSQFLSSTEKERIQTKLASIADQASSGQGIELGSWGTIDGMTVLTDIGSASQGVLLGSVGNNVINQLDNEIIEKTEKSASSSSQSTNRIICIADENQDQYAKQIISPLINEFKSLFNNNGFECDIYKPTSTIPLGGNNADCVIIFLTSLNDVTSLNNCLERILRKTISSGNIMKPPTQIIAISTVGTNRYDKMPYSMQNIMNGGKIEKRKQMEEAITRIVNTRVTIPSLDYTICKIGELKTGNNKELLFQFSPYDKLDGTTDMNTVITILTQAIAYQPYARNSTLHFVGTLLDTEQQEQERIINDECFLQLDGPELLRMNLNTISKESNSIDMIDKMFDELYEYICEWASLFADTGKGLTTPIRYNVINPKLISSSTSHYIKKQSNNIQLLFLPTSTGKNYLSKEEEKEKQRVASTLSQSNRIIKKEGGVEFIIEFTNDNILRVRVKRCNYANADAIIKELSEETIISRFKKVIDVWEKAHHTIS